MHSSLSNLRFTFVFSLGIVAGHLSGQPAETPSSPSPAGISIAAWGDSLTLGGQDGTGVTYPDVLAALSGMPVVNLGVGGQTSTQVAVRMGAIPTSVTNSFTIPTLDCAVLASFPAGREPAFNAIAGTRGYYTGQGVLGTISGVEGYVVDNDRHQYIFTPLHCPRSPVVVHAGTAWTPVLGNLLSGPQILWVGRNDLADATTVLSDVAAMVSKLKSLGNSRFLILSILNGDYPDFEWAGGGVYSAVSSLNSMLQHAYPEQFVDIRAALVKDYDPRLHEDVADHGHDVPPTSLRARYKSVPGFCRAVLAASVGPTDLKILLSTPQALSPCRTIMVDQERIEIESCTSTACSVYAGGRGWGYTKPASHRAGAALTGWDYLHLNAAGYTFVANRVFESLNLH